MHIQAQLTEQDYVAVQNLLSARQSPPNISKVPYLLLQMLLIGALVLPICYWLATKFYTDTKLLIISLCGGLIVVSDIWARIWVKSGGYQHWLAERCEGVFNWHLSQAGLTLMRKDAGNFVPWSAISALQETADYWLLFTNKKQALFIPKTAKIVSGDQGIGTQIAVYWHAHADNRGKHLTDTAPSRFTSLWSGLGANLKLGLRLAFFRQVEPLKFRVSFNDCVALIATQLLLYMLFDYAYSPKPALFNELALMHYAFVIGLMLIAVYTVCQCTISSCWQTRLFVMIQAGTIAVESIYITITFLLWYYQAATKNYNLLWYGQMVWLIAVVAFVLHLLFRLPKSSNLYYAALFALFVYGVPNIFYQQDFFYEDYGKTEDYASKWKRINSEDTFYAQPALLAQSLAKLAPQRAGKADMYFVGFAGQAEEKVFANEVKFTQHLFDKKFDTQGHSLALINSEATLNTHPLANAHNLAAALSGIGKQMNRDEDILFLYLSSHGSSKFEISVSFWPIELNDLPAKKVREILDQSGIKNRVIVVSACYSGGFIDALKDANTLILTAARKDRTSFGCGAEANFTYFGDAFFVQALNQKNEFVPAFEQAKQIIAAREKQEQADENPSEPQMFEGGQIKQTLANWYAAQH